MPSTLKLGAYFLSMEIQSTQVCISLKSLFSRHKGIGVQFTDEPTGSLDSENSEKVISLLGNMARKYNQTIGMVTHNVDIAHRADRMIRIEDGKISDERQGGYKDER